MNLFLNTNVIAFDVSIMYDVAKCYKNAFYMIDYTICFDKKGRGGGVGGANIAAIKYLCDVGGGGGGKTRGRVFGRGEMAGGGKTDASVLVVSACLRKSQPLWTHNTL